ncbi:MAG: urea carboxylase [Lasallia pustulata]|uniref:Urea carboxylase n=1 Tax=Lasallia pustulata TaxID=136370 RepID=A0A5M8PH31_9LECA|nr:MAG: urea carboxylase [Lasallia pustulata]
MEELKTLLVANRGEIASRIIRTAKSLEIRTIAIYTEADAASSHVVQADEPVLLTGGDAKGYLDGDTIINIAKERRVDAIIPGYGFLSENADFARAVAAAGMVFVGPSPESIESFGLKHTARELATKAGVPVVPGSQGLIRDQDEAVKEAERLGFPVMLKATAGGGGMGLATCKNVEEVKESFETVKSRGENLFKNAGIFIEKFYPESRHIEVQVFGNGMGNAIHFGERECSIQRRHQKVIEECPSPFVTNHPHHREKLGTAAISLAESIRYGSAGTIEYLVDDKSGDFFFLEMNTRLQVEHGITELCYSVDLVELMLRQADAELAGKGGLVGEELKKMQPSEPHGVAIEARVYAENPAKGYAPSPGTLQIVQWHNIEGSRIDTWVKTGTVVSAHYDPLLAKVMFHSPTREATLEGIHEILSESRICGPPTNLDFLAAILQDQAFASGRTLTKFLTEFRYSPAAIDVVSGGAYTQVQDYPGRPTMGRGFPHAGPMDPLAFQVANMLVGNRRGLEGLEITLNGPELLFLGPAIVAICGAPMEATLDGKSIPMWTRLRISAGQKLSVGKTIGGGCRSYLAVYGGFPTVAEWFGSKATSPGVGVGGYQGRQLASGDLLSIVKDIPGHLSKDLALPKELTPEYTRRWDILAMVGPYDEGYLLPEDIKMIYETKWQISHNAARGGIRLIGPKPKWARSNGGEGGSHPSNVVEYGYPVGTLNWTGDDPCIFPVDCPDFGGFVSSTTVIKADYWRLGQMKAGDTMQYKRVSLSDALQKRKTVDGFLDQVAQACAEKISFNEIQPLDYSSPPSALSDDHGKAVIHYIAARGNRPQTFYRQGADDYLLIEYGEGNFDLNHRCRVTALIKALRDSTGKISFSSGLINTVGCGTSLLLYYDGTKIPQAKLISFLVDLEAMLGDLSTAKVPSRIFKLPIIFESHRQTAALQRYMETQRPYASYLPDNMEFVAKNNGLERKDLEWILLNSRLLAVSVGFFCALPLCLPVDPRHRIGCPKMNPSRVFTPEGQVSWGGSCMALYNVESPGGYQLTGLTIPGVDVLGSKNGYSLDRPWLFEDFDQLTFHEVSEEEYERQLAVFHSGRYEYEWEETVFDMKEHNELLRSTKDEVKVIKERQAKAQAEMDKLEKELMEKWTEEKAEGKIPMDKVEALLNDPDISKIESPLNANVWKIQVKEGDTLEANQIVAILEAMKLEIAVRAEDDLAGSAVEKLLVRPNDSVKAGDPLVLTRTAAK